MDVFWNEMRIRVFFWVNGLWLLGKIMIIIIIYINGSKLWNIKMENV